MPRKASRSSGRRPVWERFNEAGAFMPRKAPNTSNIYKTRIRLQ